MDGREDPAPAQPAARRSSGIAREQDADDAGRPASSGSSAGPVELGTAAGSPVAGREIDHAEAAAAVERDADDECAGPAPQAAPVLGAGHGGPGA